MAKDSKERRFEWQSLRRLTQRRMVEGMKVNKCKKKLEVTVMFEPSRIAADLLVEAYAQIVPSQKRMTERISKNDNHDLPRKQAGGREK